MLSPLLFLTLETATVANVRSRELQSYGSTPMKLLVMPLGSSDTQTPLRHVDPSAVAMRLAPDSVRIEFERLADDWERRTRNLSSTGAIVRHESYQKIIKMGEPVIPLILQRMEKRPKFWFTALMEIAKPEVDPVTPDMYGDLEAMTHAWLVWGAERVTK
jgi:hypothetical protein